MPRVKINFPSKTVFETELDVYIEHMNYGAHVGNEKFLAFCHEARLRWLKSFDCDEMNFYNCSLIMSDAEISYKSQAYQGDKLKIEIGVEIQNSKSFEIFYKITNQNNKTVSMVKTGMVFFDYKENKITDGPTEWLAQFN